MNFRRRLGDTGLEVSAIGLGTVKLGRNEQVKYPSAFRIPDDTEAASLLALAQELGINLLDTAPAYGSSEERLGRLMQRREDWILCTKVGEEFSEGRSHFDFSAAHTRHSVERSLRRLRSDYLDLVLIHSDGNDLDILQQADCVETLLQLKQQGLIRAVGMSTKTVAGGLQALELLDVVMLTYNLQQRDQEVLDAATAQHRGVLVKKGLMSGHVQSESGNLVQDSMRLIFSQPGVGSMIAGTINPAHLRANVETCREILAGQQ